MFTSKRDRIKILSILFSFSLLASVQAFAQPVISSETPKTLSHGFSVTIIGSEFGTKPINPNTGDHSPLKWDDFENGVVGENLGNGWYKQNRYGGPYPQYADDITRGISSASLKQDYTYVSEKGERQYNNLFGLTNSTNPPLSGTKFYVSFYKYMATSDAHSQNYKAFSLRAGSPGAWDEPAARHDIEPYVLEKQGYVSGHIYPADCDNTVGTNVYGAGFYPLNSWNRFEYYIEHGDPGNKMGDPGNGNYYYWADFKLKASIENKVLRTCNSTWTNLYFSGYFARNRCPDITNDPSCNDLASSYIWNDDVYIDITRARVEIGDAQNWNDCTHREIQIPQTWANTGDSITVEVNQGSFSNNSCAYIFVVDENGSASVGHAICFENEIVADTTPPSVINDLQAATEQSSTELTLTWTASTDDVGVAGYRIFLNGIEIDIVIGTTYTVTNLAPSTAYIFTISAFDAAGKESSQSDPFSAVLPSTPRDDSFKAEVL